MPLPAWWDTFDIPDLLCLLLNYVLRVIEMYSITLTPLYVPPNDSLSKYPIRPDTVAADLLHTIVLITILVTVALLFLGHRFFPPWFRNINIFAAIWIWGCQAVFVELMTDLFKNFVGRPRPFFYELCGPDAEYDTCKPSVPRSSVDGAFQSWPSGHSSSAMQGFLFAGLLWKRGVASSVSWVSTLAIGLSFAAFWVGATRIKDYKHHPDDVLAGLMIAALVCGLVWYRGQYRIFPKMVAQT
jgi:phosphatidate phosphatase